MYKNIYIANDHSAIECKEAIIDALKDEFNIIDLGTNKHESCNYVEYGQKVAIAINNDEDALGIVICGSGIGISIAANRINNIRCALLYNDHVAALAKEHNNANILAFGAREMSIEDIIRRIRIFLNAKFEGGRHQLRIESLD